MIYPILDLRRYRPSLRWYADRLAQLMIATCASFGVRDAHCQDSIGVYVNRTRKIGFIGRANWLYLAIQL